MALEYWFIIAYGIIFVIVGVLSAISVYGEPGEQRPPSRIQPHNPRTAVACGVLWGICWPALLVLGTMGVIINWFENGKKESRARAS